MLTNLDIPHSPKMFEQVVERMRIKHVSLRTEKTSLDWIKRLIRFHGKYHPKEMGAAEGDPPAPRECEGHSTCDEKVFLQPESASWLRRTPCAIRLRHIGFVTDPAQ